MARSRREFLRRVGLNCAVGGVVVRDMGLVGSGRRRQLVRVDVHDPSDPDESYEVVIPGEWAVGRNR